MGIYRYNGEPLSNKSIGLFVIKFITLGISATLITFIVIQILLTPENALIGLWLYVTQPAYWFMSAIIALPFGLQNHLKIYPSVIRWAIFISVVTILGWLITYSFLKVGGQIS